MQGTFNEQNLSNAAYVCISRRARSGTLRRRRKKKPRRGRELSAQALANQGAFATTRHPAPGLYVALADQAERRVQALGAQNLASLAWAFCAARREISSSIVLGDRKGSGARLRNPGRGATSRRKPSRRCS